MESSDPAALSDELTERASRAQCFPKKALAYPGDRILMRANKPVDWSVTGGEMNGDTFTAPSSLGTVTITAADATTREDCKISVVARPNPHPGDGDGAALSVHTSLGIPSTHGTLITKSDYVISYDAQTQTPLWVSWELNGTYLGGADRGSGDFDPDEDTQLDQASDADYRNSGYDRGHMCASADRSRDQQKQLRTFVYTNAVPQLPAPNRGPWARLETDLQNLAADGHEIFIVAGPLFAAQPPTIGNGVAVPYATWKVAVVLDALGDRAPDVTAGAQVIAVVVPNDATVKQKDGWEQYAVRVRDVENATGFDLLSDVPAEVQSVLE